MDKDTLEKKDFRNHERAGLAYSGKNYEGEDEWIGTDKQWTDYENLANEI